MSYLSLIFTLVFLVGSFLVQAVASAFRVLEQTMTKEQLRAARGFVVYRAILSRFYPHDELEALLFSISCAKHIIRFGLGVSAVFLLTSQMWLGIVIILVLSLILGNFVPRMWSAHHPETALQICAPFASLFLIFALPILLVVRKRFVATYVEDVRAPVGEVKEKIMEMIQEADVETRLDADEKRLLEGVASFRDRIVREVMMPRIDIVAIPATATLREASALFNHEQYSRIPVYRETIDDVIGLLMYKDLLEVYFEQDDSTFDRPVEEFIKPIVYVPETSHVTHLLHEFRRKKTHLAVVVDEYGGTEGLVTMEDCLEEIVGEIADETDEAQKRLFSPDTEGGWIVDARMTIHDIEEQFGLKVPQEGEYDTIGGYAFHRAGEIPAKGLVIHHDAFDLEILETTERNVVRVKITPRKAE